MRVVYLIRHGQGPNNILGKRRSLSAGRFNQLQELLNRLPITPRGRRQAVQTAQTLRRLVDGDLQRLSTSPYGRARSTARVIGHRLGVTPQVLDDLREIGPDHLDGAMPRMPLGLHYLTAYAAMFWPPSRGESSYHGLWRARSVWKRLSTQPADAVAVVSHNWFIATLLLYLRLHPRWRINNADRKKGGITVVERR